MHAACEGPGLASFWDLPSPLTCHTKSCCMACHMGLSLLLAVQLAIRPHHSKSLRKVFQSLFCVQHQQAGRADAMAAQLASTCFWMSRRSHHAMNFTTMCRTVSRHGSLADPRLAHAPGHCSAALHVLHKPPALCTDNAQCCRQCSPAGSCPGSADG